MYPVSIGSKYPLLSRLVPFTAIWLWPGVVGCWAVMLSIVPPSSSGLFGWTTQWFVDGMASMTLVASVLAIAYRPHLLVARLIFLIVPGFVFLGRMSTFVMMEGIFVAEGWKPRVFGFVTYALVSTGHVVITSMAVMFMSDPGGSRVRSTR